MSMHKLTKQTLLHQPRDGHHKFSSWMQNIGNQHSNSNSIQYSHPFILHYCLPYTIAKYILA